MYEQVLYVRATSTEICTNKCYTYEFQVMLYVRTSTKCTSNEYIDMYEQVLYVQVTSTVIYMNKYDM